MSALESRRWFGETHHNAMIFHDCDRCMQRIEPGDRYTRCAERIGRRILVWKYHDNPDCPEDPFKEHHEREELPAPVQQFKLAA